MARKPENVAETAKEPVTTPKPPVLDDVTVKETFADDFLGVSAVGPNFHLNFGARRPMRGAAADTPKLASFVSARVVVPLEAVMELYAAIGGVVESLEKRGVVRRVTPAQKG